MSRFNTRGHQTKPPVAMATSPITTMSKTPDTRTFEGGPGWTRTAQGELLLRATGAFLDGKADFYENGADRDDRLRQLVAKVAIEDPQWGFEFFTWLRGPGNIRTAAHAGAVDFVKARLDEENRLSKIPGPAAVTLRGDTGLNRRIIDAVCQRADEPGEILAYWTALYGRRVPKPVKRGIADAVRRLYSEYTLLKYDTPSHGYRFGDVLNLCHPRPKEMVGVPQWQYRVEGYEECPTPLKRRYATTESVPAIHQKSQNPLRAYACKCGWYHATSNLSPYGEQVIIDDLERQVNRLFVGTDTQQGDLFKHALDRRHHPDTATVPPRLSTLLAREQLMATPVDQRRKTMLQHNDLLQRAGMTWEALAGWLQGPMDKDAWEAMIPSMGIMAQIRNLRNFDQAGVSDAVAQQIIAKLTDPGEIARSRQFPFRFLSAHRATKDAGSLRWAYPLEQALNHSLSNVPHLGGHTLILVDRSPSMFPEYGYYTPNETDKQLGLPRADQAAIFGCALALRAEKPTLVEFGFQSNVMRVPKGGSVLPLVDTFTMIQGTDIPSAVKKHYANHDRVIVITDEQTRPGYFPSNGGGYHGGMRETAIDALVPLNVPVFMWNLAGYKASAMPTGSNARFTLGGLSDQAFKLVPLLEAGSEGAWPWTVSQGN